MTMTTATDTRDTLTAEVEAAEARLAELERSARDGAKVSPADLTAARQDLDVARLRLDGLPERERRAAEAEDKARAEAIAAEHEQTLREAASRVVELVKAATAAIRELPAAIAAYRKAVTDAHLALRTVRHKPEGYATSMGDQYLPGPSVTLAGRTWAAPHSLDQAAMLEPLSRALPKVTSAPAASALRHAATGAGERQHPLRGRTYPATDVLRAALDR
jgi:hypothetical protein